VAASGGRLAESGTRDKVKIEPGRLNNPLGGGKIWISLSRDLGDCGITGP